MDRLSKDELLQLNGLLGAAANMLNPEMKKISELVSDKNEDAVTLYLLAMKAINTIKKNYGTIESLERHHAHHSRTIWLYG